MFAFRQETEDAADDAVEDQRAAMKIEEVEAEDRLQIVLRHMHDRMYALTEECRRNSNEWCKVAGETAILRSQLEAAHSQLEAAADSLKAITDSSGFRFLQVLRSIRLFAAPRDSFRERWGMASFRAARDLGRRLRGARRPVADASQAAVASGQAESAPPPPSSAICLKTTCGAGVPPAACSRDGCTTKHEADSPPPAEPAALAYSPRNWRFQENSPPEAEFLNLMILSATGRAGSTLLQRICNARKGTLIWGEHAGALVQFARIYESVAGFSWVWGQQRENYFGQGENPNLWIANMCPDLEYVQQAVIRSSRTLLNGLYGQYRELHDIVGFKEIAYGRGEMELLRACYPKAHFLLLVRNPLNTWKSTPRDWYLTMDDWIEKWNQGVRCILSLIATDDRCHLIRYEDLIRKDAKTMAVVGETAKVTPEQIALVLENKIGSNNAGLNETERDAILERCRELMETLGYR